MSTVSTLIEDYVEFQRGIGRWKIQIVAYHLGDKHICIVNNLDPGATICRVSAGTRKEALRKGLTEANNLLARTAYLEPPKAREPAKLALIEYLDGADSASFEVDTFLQLPMDYRVKCLSEGKLLFRDSHGDLMASGDAMRCLNEACAA